MKDLTLEGAEFNRISALGGMRVGSSLSGDVFVGGVEDFQSDAVGRLVLHALRAEHKVVFDEVFSVFNKGITVQSAAGIVLEESLTTKGSVTYLSTGTGTLTVAEYKGLSTTNQKLIVTADDLDLRGSAQLSTGNTLLVVECTTAGHLVGLGGQAKDMTISGLELQLVTAEGITIGGATCGPQTVTGITTQNGQYLTGVISLLAVRDQAYVEFTGLSSTFVALNVKSDSGIRVEKDVSTSTGALYLDGDTHDSSSLDQGAGVFFTDGTTLVSELVLTLESTTGKLVPFGEMSIKVSHTLTPLHPYRDDAQLKLQMGLSYKPLHTARMDFK